MDELDYQEYPPLLGINLTRNIEPGWEYVPQKYNNPLKPSYLQKFSYAWTISQIFNPIELFSDFIKIT